MIGQNWRELAFQGTRQSLQQEPECVESWIKATEVATTEGAPGKEVEGMIALLEKPFKEHAHDMNEYPLMTNEVTAIIADGGNPLLAMEDGLWCAFSDFMGKGNFTLARRTALLGFYLAEAAFCKPDKVMEWAGNLYEVSLALGEEGNAEFFSELGKASYQPLSSGGHYE